MGNGVGRYKEFLFMYFFLSSSAERRAMQKKNNIKGLLLYILPSLVLCKEKKENLSKYFKEFPVNGIFRRKIYPLAENCIVHVFRSKREKQRFVISSRNTFRVPGYWNTYFRKKHISEQENYKVHVFKVKKNIGYL